MRSALEHERDLIPNARHLDRLAVDHARLVLELRGRIHRGLVEQRARRFDDADILRRPRPRDGELDDDVTRETALRRTRRVDGLHVDDRQILAVADADAETADLETRA